MPFVDVQKGSCDKICRITATVHPGRLRWNKIIGVWKISFLSKWVMAVGSSRSSSRGVTSRRSSPKPRMIHLEPNTPEVFFGGRNFKVDHPFPQGMF